MVEQTKKMVPTIRFKGFFDDWEDKTFGGLLPITSAARVHKNEWTKFGVPFFRSSDVVSNYKGNENSKAFISFELYRELSDKTGCVEKGDILVTGGGSIGIPYLVNSNDPLYFKDADLLWFKVRGNINSYYLYTYFSAQPFRRYLKSISHIGTIAHYTVEQAKSTPIGIPGNFDEQFKIGTYFQKIDQMIELHQRKHEKLVTLKKAMLKKMFPQNKATTPEIRFKGFLEPWEEKKIEKLAIIKTGFPFESNDFDDCGTYLVITNGNIQNESPHVDNTSGNRIYITNAQLIDEYGLSKGDILVTMDGSVGRTAKVIKEYQILAQRVGRLIPQIDPDFLYQSLNTGEFLKEMTLLSHGGTIKHISLSEIEDYSLQIPSDKQEQQKIGTYFRQLDELIEQHGTQLTKLKQIKTACLEKMFV